MFFFVISDPSILGRWGQTKSRIQDKELYATLCLQGIYNKLPHFIYRPYI